MGQPIVWFRKLFGILVLATICLGAASPASAQVNSRELPDVAVRQILAKAKAKTTTPCSKTTGRLRAIVCSGVLRVGVRDDYPLFGYYNHGRWSGYEIAIARRLARELGVSLSLTKVTPTNRIAVLAGHRVDVVIATMGDTTLRDSQATLIKPHYYESSTVVVGPRDLRLPNIRDVDGRTVCVTVGNDSNTKLTAHGARLMLFDSPAELIRRLRSGACALVAQDNSFFARSFFSKNFATRYDVKFAFDQVPWSMAVAKRGSGQLAKVLALLSQIFLRDGTFVKLARANYISPAFLIGRRKIWARPECNRVTPDPHCDLKPLQSDMQRTSFASTVISAQRWLARHVGLHLKLTIFTLAPAWHSVQQGIRNSLILIVGAIGATLGFALLIAYTLSIRFLPVRWAMRFAIILLQSAPPVLTLVIAAALAGIVFRFSSTLAIAASILALGLINGAYAGQAIAEAINTLRAEDLSRPTGQPKRYEDHLILHGLRRSTRQVIAFLVNATKGTPIASFIGAPELLNTLTDSTSSSSAHATTYWFLLIFYVTAVLVVVGLCSALGTMLDRRMSTS